MCGVWGPRWRLACVSMSMSPTGLRVSTLLEGPTVLRCRRGPHGLRVRPQVRGHVEKVSGPGGQRLGPYGLPSRDLSWHPGAWMAAVLVASGSRVSLPWRCRVLQTCHDDAAKFVQLLTSPGCSYLVQEDFVPFLQVSRVPSLATHPMGPLAAFQSHVPHAPPGWVRRHTVPDFCCSRCTGPAGRCGCPCVRGLPHVNVHGDGASWGPVSPSTCPVFLRMW